MGDEVLVRVENVSKKFCRSLKKSLWYGVQDIASELVGRKHEDELRPDEFWAINDVSFELRRGECLGLIGRNGAGKSTLLKLLNGLIKPDKGCIEIYGKVGGLIALGAGFNPILSGRENIYVNASVLGLTKAEINARFEEIVEFAELKEFIDAPVQTYSSGMQVRLGFSVAAVLLKPDVLLLDEVLAVGDARFQSKCINTVRKLSSEGTAIVFVSHNMHEILRYCDLGLYLSRGQVLHQGSIENVSAVYIQDSDQEAECQAHDIGNVQVSESLYLGAVYAVNEAGSLLKSISVGRPVVFRLPMKYKDIPTSSIVVELAINDDSGLIFHKLSPMISLPSSLHEKAVELEIEIPIFPLTSARLTIGVAIWSPKQRVLYGWSRNNYFRFDGLVSPGRLDLSTRFKLITPRD